MSGARPVKQDRRAEARAKAAAEREQQRRTVRRRRTIVITVAAVAAAAVIAGVAGVISLAGGAGGADGGGMGPEGIPLESGTALAANTTATNGATEDGIQCNAAEQAVSHTHAHLAVYVNGRQRYLPAGVGMNTPAEESTADGGFYAATSCYYWLHVHARDGIIHIEAPKHQTYTLGQFFAVWRQPLDSTRVAGAHGTETVFVGGKRYHGDPADIPLTARADIQIDIGTPVPFQPVDWGSSGL